GIISAGSVDIDSFGRLIVGTFSQATLNVTNSLTVRTNASLTFNNGTLTVGGLLDVSGTIGFRTGTNIVLKTNTLSFSGNGQIDVADSDMIIDSSPLSLVKSYVQSGYASGAWNGLGIKSAVAAGTQASAHKTELGYGQASTLGLSSFDGYPLLSSSVLVKYT